MQRRALAAGAAAAEPGRLRGRRAVLSPDRCRRRCRSTFPGARRCRSVMHRRPLARASAAVSRRFEVLVSEKSRRVGGAGAGAPLRRSASRPLTSGKSNVSRKSPSEVGDRQIVGGSGAACPDRTTSARRPSIREPSTSSSRRIRIRRTGSRKFGHFRRLPAVIIRGQVQDERRIAGIEWSEAWGLIPDPLHWVQRRLEARRWSCDFPDSNFSPSILPLSSDASESKRSTPCRILCAVSYS